MVEQQRTLEQRIIIGEPGTVTGTGEQEYLTFPVRFHKQGVSIGSHPHHPLPDVSDRIPDPSVSLGIQTQKYLGTLIPPEVAFLPERTRGLGEWVKRGMCSIFFHNRTTFCDIFFLY
jgi:hypothetical protein